MNLKFQKLHLHLLEYYEKSIYKDLVITRDPFFIDFFSKKELIEILESIYGRACMLNDKCEHFSYEQLFRLIKLDASFVHYLKEKILTNLEALPNLMQNDVNDFFKSIHFELHYLSAKPIEEWDVYDRNHYRTLLQRAGVKLNTNQKSNTNENKR